MNNITATEPQVNFIKKLMLERDYTSLKVSEIENRVQNGPLSKTDASTLISLLKGCPSKAVAKATASVEAGFYLMNDRVFKVVKSKSSGNLYAKVLDTPLYGKATFEYAPGAIMKLSEAGSKLTVEDAAKLGQHHGVCMICGAELTDPKSVEAGIGPVCAGKL